MFSVRENYQKFLEFENQGEVLKYRYHYKNMLIWPFIRCIIWDAVLRSQKDFDNGDVNHSTAGLTGKDKLFAYQWKNFFSVSKNPLFGKKNIDIVFLYFSVGNIKDESGNYVNRIHDEFVSYHTNTAIIETDFFFRHLQPKKYLTYTSDFIDILNLFGEKILPLNKKDRETIAKLMNYLKSNIPFFIAPDEWNNIQTEMIRYAKTNRYIYSYYKLVFKRQRPKLVFVAQGCYGNHAACKLKLLSDMKIPTAEIQHGLVNRTHRAYNYSNSIFESTEYQEYMPGTFLTFGSFWKQAVRLPIETRVLGSANFGKNISSIKASEYTGEMAVLILPSEDKDWLELTKYVIRQLPQRQIIIKVHPRKEKHFFVYRELQSANIKVYMKENIYDFFAMTDCVVGDNTTVLYEAQALGKKVFVWDNERSKACIYEELGTWFETGEELVGLLKGITEVKKVSEPQEELFSLNMEKNYREYIKQFLG